MTYDLICYVKNFKNYVIYFLRIFVIISSYLNTLEKFSRVNFHYNLSTASNKKDFAHNYFKQLALEIINNTSLNDIKIYTGGSKTDKQAGSGIYIETPRDKYSMKQHNTDFCSVFRSELLAIDVGLETIRSETTLETSGFILIAVAQFSILKTGPT
ncbi:hypothetical protein AVEN_222135-1 [Araneus ventricosus]|uniref:RNase H type-1 domain-containing protein n=1 Tax=Araneus ventricosus TaxID=182803 RepID=A0A4Y2MU23_ARAVE|nr:hypothetical protein AVEN_222135-1 [Araneus ventricosus]